MKAKEKQFLTEKFNGYQNGQLSDAEKKIIDDWFDAKMDELSLAANHTPITVAKLEQQLFANIKQAIHQDRLKKNWSKNGWLQMACTVMILCGLSFFILSDQLKNKTEAPTTWQSYSTLKAEVKKMVLPDGTIIWMNAETKIRLSPDFGTSNSRKLHLDYGEAYFEVKRDTLKPFSITTQQFVTTVLGTSFNIKSYPELKSYQVAVATGKVKVDCHTAGKTIQLSSGLLKDQVLTYNLDTKKTGIMLQDVAHLIEWKSKRSLNFENLTLAQIAAELSRQYNIKVQISGTQQSGKTYHLQLEHQPLQRLLKQIVLKTGISYQLSNQVLILNTDL